MARYVAWQLKACEKGGWIAYRNLLARAELDDMYREMCLSTSNAGVDEDLMSGCPPCATEIDG